MTAIAVTIDSARFASVLFRPVASAVVDVDGVEHIVPWRETATFEVDPGAHRVAILCRWFGRWETRRASSVIDVAAGTTKPLWMRVGNLSGERFTIHENPRGAYVYGR